MYDVVIIGCGVVGAAAAYELSRYDISVVVLERENDVAMGTTKANSGIIHAGYGSEPSSLMAKLNVEGARLAKELCEKLDVPYRQCGSLVLAFTKKEISVLEQLLQDGMMNGVPGIQIIGKETVLDMEPNLSYDVEAALYAPSAMVVSPWEYALALAETAVKNGVKINLEYTVDAIDKTGDGYKLQTNFGSLEARCVINAAGLYADKIHNMIAEPTFEIIPTKGEYYLLDKNKGKHVKHVIFQCPTEESKGVLVTPTVHGNLLVGPGSDRIWDRGNVSTTAQGLDYVMKLAHRASPGIDFNANIRNYAGNRARSDHDDFIISEAAPGFIDLAGICSPGLSAAPAIAKMAVKMLENNGLVLSKKQLFHDKRRKVRFNELTSDEKASLVASDPAYGRVVCRCETVTEGEVRDALSGLIPPCSVDAIKRRTGTGMGRCQAGFCGPRVLDLLAKHCRCKPTDVLQDGAGTHILISETGRKI